MIIGVPKEVQIGENRVAVVPDTVTKLIKLGYKINVEENAGIKASFSNDAYTKAGASIVKNALNLFNDSDIILKIQKPEPEEIQLMKDGAISVSFVYPTINTNLVNLALRKKILLLAMELIPRITKAQRMDALSSQSNLAGYKTVLMAANHLKKIFPLMMTAAGTISPAKVVVMGAGVAGLQALATARRLGAIVEVSDIRPQVKEEVLSLGGRFIEVETDKSLQDERGYAKEVSQEFLQKQQALIFKHITEADIVITTALVPGKKAPVLVTEEMVKKMRPGSVIIDMAVEFGGNCEISEPGKVVEKYGVTIIGESNIPSLVATHASELYSKNIFSLVEYLTKEGKLVLDINDEIVKSILIKRKEEV